ncbi:hypothetical protein tb265_06040 [Gemmatimonadetes bacterium T265]|nr:hypothetical protein tb265_06040 [Gemmatimonadetes bacterium T265]
MASAVFVAGAACNAPTAADAPDVAGAWDGRYVEALVPARALDARLQLTQNGVNVSGTLLLANGRSADASGPIVGRHLALALSYADDCAGTARWSLDLGADGSTFTGTAESFDCRGDTRADVTLVRR